MASTAGLPQPPLWQIGADLEGQVGKQGGGAAARLFCEANGWHILRFNTVEIQHKHPVALTRIREAINRYGGIEDDSGVVRRYQRDGRLGPGQESLELFD